MSVFRGASVGVTLTANKSRYSKELKQARAEMRDWERTVDRSMGRATGVMKGFAKAGAVALGAGLALTVREGVAELVEMQKASAQSAAGLRSTGNAANTSVKGIEDLAGAIMRKSGIDDQAIQSGANLLLTFTNVRNEVGAGNRVFDRATQAAADLSARGFGSVESASKMLGKALNDPVKGVTAMSRAGVTFTDQQKEQIKTLTESGRVLDAQKLILKEVETQVGGSAAAYGKTLAGQVSIARERFAGLSAELVGRAVPSFVKLMDASGEAMTKFDAWTHTSEGRAAIAEAGRIADGVGRTFVNVTRFLWDHRTAVTNLAIGYGAFRVVTGILGPLNAAWQLGQANAVRYAAANAQVTRTAVASRAALALVGGPIGIVAGAAAIGAMAFINYKRKMAAVESQGDRTSRAIRGISSAMSGLNSAALELDEARLNRKMSLASLDDARKRLKNAKAGTTEYRDALLAVEQAELGVKRANQQVAQSRNGFNKAVEKSAGAHAKAKTEAAKEREVIARLETQIAKATKKRESGVLGADAARAAEKKLNAELKKAKERLDDANMKMDRAADKLQNMSGKTDQARAAWRDLAAAIRDADSAAGNYTPPAFGGMGGGRGGGGRGARSSRSIEKNARAAAKAAHPMVRQARTAAAIEANPVRALALANRQFAAAAAALRRATPANRVERREAARAAAANVVSREQAVAAAAAEKQRLAAEKQAQAAEDQRLAAADARQAALDAPRTAMTLTDAMRDLERAQAEATATLADDIAVAQAALADERARQAQIHAVLGRADLAADERAALIDQLTASVRTTNQLSGSIEAMTEEQKTALGAAGARGVTLADLQIEIRSAAQAIVAASATEAGNVFAISKLEQVVQGGSTDFWALQTQAQLQGAVGA